MSSTTDHMLVPGHHFLGPLQTPGANLRAYFMSCFVSSTTPLFDALLPIPGQAHQNRDHFALQLIHFDSDALLVRPAPEFPRKSGINTSHTYTLHTHTHTSHAGTGFHILIYARRGKASQGDRSEHNHAAECRPIETCQMCFLCIC